MADNRLVTKDELSKHNNAEDLWLAIHGKVYNVTTFDHPGGKKLLVNLAGTDATRDYDKYMHSKKWVLELPSCHYVGLYEIQSAPQKKEKPAKEPKPAKTEEKSRLPEETRTTKRSTCTIL